ncbi:HTTM domain-containing protein [Sneathiella glossodoripedis]|uniref:HTTM domain-containing protein n=1 Tax=Sneathiella glossodoripedis TaxID=418853 RepID=UPI00046F5749|nr:HTTM domain-containing protein [Sneathiella glossodoripedis]
MTLQEAIGYSEILLALAFIQQSFEHLTARRRERILFSIRILLSVCLLAGFYADWALLGLFILYLVQLSWFEGPYNGGSDRMGILILTALLIANFSPALLVRELAFGYLALQLVLSYFISGWVKIRNPDWRSGLALNDVFRFSAYPVSDQIRQFAASPRLLFVMSWAVMLFELLFPLCLLHPISLTLGLAIAALFHLANACLFGLNRFFWIWLCAYPSIIWFQERFIQI